MSEFNKRKVVELLQSFSKEELNDFTGFVGYKGRKSVLALWKFVKRSHPKYRLTDQEVYEAVNPGKPFRDNVYRVWLAELAKLGKEFLAFQALYANKPLFNNTLSMTLLKRRLGDLAQKTLDKNRKLLKDTPRHSTLYYGHYYQQEDIAYQFVTLLKHRALTDSLQNAANYLDYSFLALKLKLLFAMRNRARIVKEDYDYRMEELVLGYLAQNPHEELPLIHLYYLMLRLMRDLDDEESFKAFLVYFQANHQHIVPEENRQLVTGALNFCLWNIQLGRMAYLQDRFALAKTMVSEGLIVVEDKVSSFRFRSMVQIGIEAGELDWTEAFIDNWRSKTEEKHRHNLEAYSRAVLHFARGDYEKQEKWMDLMLNADFSFIDTNNELIFRTLVLKTAYQRLASESSSLFESQVEAYRNYVKRKKKVAETYRLSANNFRKALYQLYQKRRGKALKVGDLRAYILTLKPIRELPWLMEKLGEVE